MTASADCGETGPHLALFAESLGSATSEFVERRTETFETRAQRRGRTADANAEVLWHLENVPGTTAVSYFARNS